MMRELLDVERELLTGIQPERIYSAGVLWEDGSNVIAAEDGIRPTYPQGPFTEKMHIKAINYLLPTNFGDGKNRLYSASQDILSEWTDEDGRRDISRIGGYPGSSDSDLWSLVEFNDWIYGTNNVYLQKFDPATSNMVTLGVESVFANGKIMAKLKDHLLVFNLDIDSRGYAWCHARDTSSWIPAGDNLAGFDRFTSMDSEIRAVVPLREGLVAYSANEAHAVTHIGSPLVFKNQEITKGLGAVNQNAVVVAKNMHWGFGQNGIWVFDGVNVKYIDEPIKKQVLTNNFNEDYAHKVVAWHSSKENMVFFFWPGAEATVNDHAWGFNYEEHSWWKFGYVRSAGVEAGLFDYGITGDELGNIYRQFEPGQASDDITYSSDAVPIQVMDSPYIKRPYNTFAYGQSGYGDVVKYG